MHCLPRHTTPSNWPSFPGRQTFHNIGPSNLLWSSIRGPHSSPPCSELNCIWSTWTAYYSQAPCVSSYLPVFAQGVFSDKRIILELLCWQTASFKVQLEDAWWALPALLCPHIPHYWDSFPHWTVSSLGEGAIGLGWRGQALETELGLNPSPIAS